MGSHQSAQMKSDTWLTPPEIIKSLGKFDIDPCCPFNMPWKTADVMWDREGDFDGLRYPWGARVWLNPPYSREASKWLKKMADHGNGIAMTFARTETTWFDSQIWKRADAILFIRGRIHFHHLDGTRAEANAGAPSCLVAYGKENSLALAMSGIKGTFISDWRLF